MADSLSHLSLVKRSFENYFGLNLFMFRTSGNLFVVRKETRTTCIEEIHADWSQLVTPGHCSIGHWLLNWLSYFGNWNLHKYLYFQTAFNDIFMGTIRTFTNSLIKKRTYGS